VPLFCVVSPSRTCTGPEVDGEPSNIVRSPDGTHFCPVKAANEEGEIGGCPTYSSGAFRYAFAMVGALAIPSPSEPLAWYTEQLIWLSSGWPVRVRGRVTSTIPGRWREVTESGCSLRQIEASRTPNRARRAVVPGGRGATARPRGHARMGRDEPIARYVEWLTAPVGISAASSRLDRKRRRTPLHCR
jgi:hypothetical protein